MSLVSDPTDEIKSHIKKNFELVCEPCGFYATNVGQLKSPEAKHASVCYYCDQCEYVSTINHHMKQHKESKHEGIRYRCDQCDYVWTYNHDLKKHTKSKHEGIGYPSDQCEYLDTRSNDLNKHKKAKHEGTRVTNVSIRLLGPMI